MFSKVALTFRSRKLHLKNQPVLIPNQVRLPKQRAEDSRAQGPCCCAPPPAPPLPREGRSQQAWGGAQEFAWGTSSQVMVNSD